MQSQSTSTEVRRQDQYPLGTTALGDVVIVRTTTSFRHAALTEHGPRAHKPFKIDYQKRDQTFPCLYAAVTQVISDCGACCRADLAFIPALSRYTPFQLERALLTAEHHGLLRRVGTIPRHHPDAPSGDDPDLEMPGIYDIDHAGPIDRSDPDNTVARALATRNALEMSWLDASRKEKG